MQRHGCVPSFGQAPTRQALCSRKSGQRMFSRQHPAASRALAPDFLNWLLCQRCACRVCPRRRIRPEIRASGKGRSAFGSFWPRAVADTDRDGFGPAAVRLQRAAMTWGTRPASNCSLIRSIHAFRSPFYRVTACTAADAYSSAWNWLRVKVPLLPDKISSQAGGNHRCAASNRPDTRMRLNQCPKLNKEKPVSQGAHTRNCSIIGT